MDSAAVRIFVCPSVCPQADDPLSADPEELQNAAVFKAFVTIPLFMLARGIDTFTSELAQGDSSSTSFSSAS